MVKINLSILVFRPTIYLATLKVYKKFDDFGSHRSRETCDKKFLLERKKKNRSNFGEVDVAPAKTDKVNKVEKR